ncbi:MAG: response regulator [Bdellovibrionales bacterium]|nr:response regulator [Bdellovibrionales bacterium]
MNKKVLIADDEDIVRRSLVRVCRGKNWDISEAKNGEEALKIWLEFEPDLVYLDVLMPGLSGPQVLKELGDRRQSKVILISAYSGEYDNQTIHSLGADLFIQKPFQDIFEVINKGEELLNGL